MDLIKNIISLLSFVFASVFSLSLLAIVGLFAFMIFSLGSNAEVPMIKKSDRAVGVVELLGEIVTADGFRKQFNKMHEDKDIKALVVRIDSPGGAVGASEEIFRIISESTKPVVCSLGNVAASGGLYAALGCDKIVSNNGTITGSIGVILFMPNVSQIVDKVGFKMNIVKSGKFKDTGSPFRDLVSEDQGLLQDLVGQSYEQFVQVVAKSRGLEIEKVKSFADGRIILGQHAVELGLVDEIGGLERAGKIALNLANITTGEPEFVYSSKQRAILELFQQLDESVNGFIGRSKMQLKFL